MHENVRAALLDMGQRLRGSAEAHRSRAEKMIIEADREREAAVVADKSAEEYETAAAALDVD